MKLDPNLKEAIVHVAIKYAEIEKLTLFGSRARGDNHLNSDIDLAAYTKNNQFLRFALFVDELEEINTLLKFDVIVINNHLTKIFLENIKKDQEVLMDKFQDKYNHFVHATQRLCESIAEYDQTGSNSVRDGAIQRFEFTVELAWKTTREYLLRQGFAELNSPKAVMKNAYSAGLLCDEESWINMLNDRNLTSHIYQEQTANEIYARIVNCYIEQFDQLIKKLGE